MRALYYSVDITLIRYGFYLLPALRLFSRTITRPFFFFFNPIIMIPPLHCLVRIKARVEFLVCGSVNYFYYLQALVRVQDSGVLPMCVC